MIPAAIYPGEFSRIAANISDGTKLELIQLTLSTAVPIEIDNLRAQDPLGPNDYQRDAAHHYIQQQRLGESIMFACQFETRESMRLLCQIVAILAWCPGGIDMFGLRFEAKAEVNE